MIKRKTMYFLAAALATAGVVGMYSQAYAHTGGDVQLLQADGTNVAAGVPYSPKATCARACHDNEAAGDGPDDLSAWSGYVAGTDMTFQHNYESDWTLAAKTQYNRAGTKISYDVPYPEHGVSAGYHFQQGRNIDWDDTQRTAYGLPEFTSSAGMYGKY